MSDPKNRRGIEFMIEALDDVPVDEVSAEDAVRRLGIDVKSWARNIRRRVAMATPEGRHSTWSRRTLTALEGLQMAFLDKLMGLFRREEVPPELAALGMTRESMRAVREELEREQRNPPRIAVIGETGVGKSSTLNALFNQGRDGLKISHTKACTEVDQELEVTGEAGERIIVADMPGLGEDVETDERHYATYKRVLPTVDLALWIIKADNRAMTHVQQALRRLIADGALEPSHLVVAINQVDLLQPGSWDDVINQPSPEQDNTIRARRADIEAKIRKVVDFPTDRIVAYSALKYHNLKPLLRGMLAACEDRRKVVLFQRARCASFSQLVDPEILAEAM